MRKVGLFIGFLSDSETQRDSQIAQILQLLKEQERRTSRREILLFVAGIVVTVIVDVAFRLLGH